MPSTIAPTPRTIPSAGVAHRTSFRPKATNATRTSPGGTGTADPTAARRAISGGATPGLTLPRRNPASGVSTGTSAPASSTAPASTTPASDTSAVDKAKKLMEDIKTFSGYRKQLKDAADVLANTGSLGVKLGELTLDGAKKCQALTKKLWKKGFFGKIGAIFTGLATGLLYALGGIVFGLGKLLGWIAWPLQKIAGSTSTDSKKKKAAQTKKDAQKKVDGAKANAKKKLEALKKTSTAHQARVLGEVARMAGLNGGKPLSAEQHERAVALLELASEVGLRIPNLDTSVLDRSPADTAANRRMAA